ncbi:MAG: phage tail tape measure protein, partial [Clostridia bacterium]|nr:phage tail tape measure protein [Clostridia bacterium]
MADGSVIIDSRLDSSGFEKGLQNLGGIAQKGLGIVSTGIAAVSAGLTAAGGFAVKAGMSFDSAMSQVAATMGTTVDQIGVLSDVAKEMGATTAFSATEAAEALNYLALAGYDAATAADTLPAVLNLAAAGGMDLAYASDLATDAMSALGIEASNANLTEFGDKMAMTASKANTSVAQLGEAILSVGGTAKSLAGGTTELNTALGVLANRGIKGAEGGTHLRNVILALTAPTDKAAEAMKALGISATDSSGNMRPLNEILADFNTKMAGMSEAAKTQALNEIFNKTDLAAVQGLLAGVGDEWDKLAGSISNAGGAMQTMADTQLDNLEGDITILKSALEGLG